LGRINFRNLKEAKKQAEDENPSREPAPQIGCLGCPMCRYEEMRCRPQSGTLDV
jgi:hypothetical protein